MKSTFVGVFILIGMISVTSVCYTRDLCHERLVKKQYDDAIRECTRQINGEIDVDNVGIAYANRGIAHYAKEQYDEAIADYRKAVELNPKNPYPYYNMACIYSIRACEQLRKSVENGFKDWDGIKKDEDLDNIRNSSCYKEIIRE